MSKNLEYVERVEQVLNEVLPAAGIRPDELSEAMRYAVGSGGKRIRPCVCMAAAEAVGGTADDAGYPAAAVELLHNYTLVHDDLPAMDNDEERRGRPTVWKRYGEANAILVGDALQALAYRTAALAPRNAAEIVRVLGEKGVGVVCGQIEDIAPRRSPESVPFIYLHKTADLFVAAAEMGALAGGGSAEHVGRLGEFGLHLGLAFQHEDDLLDGDSPFPPGETERLVKSETALAVAALDGLPGDAAFLKSLAEGLVGRRA